jgi:hypothetical protein
MIEINNILIPTEEKIVENNAPLVFGKYGSSIYPMIILMKTKGFRLIYNISCNSIYDQEKYYSLYLSKPYRPTDFYKYEGIYGESFWKELNFSQNGASCRTR